MMRKKLKINQKDTVEIIAGADKGKKGVVLAIDHKSLRIKVQGVRMQTHFDKKEGQFEREGFLDYSNVKLLTKAKPPAKKKTAAKA